MKKSNKKFIAILMMFALAAGLSAKSKTIINSNPMGNTRWSILLDGTCVSSSRM